MIRAGDVIRPSAANKGPMAFIGFSWRVAIRFLTEGRFQSLLVILGVAAGVAVVTYISALISGLQGNTIKRTLGVQPHVSIRPVKDVPIAAWRGPDWRTAAPQGADLVLVTEQPRAQRTRSIGNWRPLQDALEADRDVTGVSPMAAGAALAQRGQGSRAINLIGIELERYDRIASLIEKVYAGTPRLAPGEAIIGRELADDLGVQLGDRFTVLTGNPSGQPTGAGAGESMRAVALYDAGIRDVNRRNVYVPLRTAQSLLAIPGGITNLDLTVSQVFEADRIARRLAAGQPYDIESWMQTNSQLLSALNAQTVSTRLIRLVVMIVVVLGIASVLVVSVVQRSKEIGILRAMGASRAQMIGVFLFQGGIVGAIGSTLGALLAWAMIWLFTALVKGADGKPLFPLVLEPAVFVNVALIATVCGVLAAVAPARRAARLDPAQAIRL